ncbi:MAG TPA: Smr/MutS family protein [Verrucomicrobiae bacterium]|nr:Smr/MutS family protein [Verrucomicrobiae bacterium]
MADDSDEAFGEPVPLPIDGILDLHTIQPREVKDALIAYLDACEQQGIFELRIIHGKGIGNLQRTVHSILQKHPKVISFTLASELYGGSGATIVRLRRSI